MKLRKNSSYEIIDDALDYKQFENVKNYICSSSFSWYFQNTVAYLDGHSELVKEPLTELQQIYNDMYIHTIYADHLLNTTHEVWETIEPIINMLKIKSLIRIKVNSYPRTSEIIHHKNHFDFPFEHKGALFYVNDCDGLTVLEDGTEIENVANRLLLFDASKSHHSTTTTNKSRRLNINFNYF
jgi:hypothetical protein